MNTQTPNREYHIGSGLASAMFVMGTRRVQWLNNWRDTRAFEADNKYAPLQALMSSLRSVAGNRTQQPNLALAASVPTGEDLDPNEYCKKCRHRHKNRYCHRLHPELAPQKGNHSRKGKGKGNVALEYESNNSDSETDGIIVACSRLNTNRTIYDTGASHHFITCEKLFCDMQKLSKPFKFDQAVGNTCLNRQGTAKLKIGSIVIKLHEALYSPSSSCNIVSAGRLQRLANVYANNDKSLLIQRHTSGPDVPISRLLCKNDVYYIYPLEADTPRVNPIIAPGVARIPVTTSAQRWHQRLGHIGQGILKKTAQYAKGMEGIDMSELSTCETCHLSKAQRFVSREPRPTPHSPLDEIFVDTVGKIAPAINGHQYAVIITDAKTRMRWAITTTSKDKIASLLIQWIEFQNSHFGKRIRAIFRDGGTEFLRMQSYCEQHGIRTDISAPSTPEQNGVSEAANKVILRLARSMLIDARMPATYWPWAVDHACFIANRLYCLRTKQIPLTDFMQGLNQPHTGQVDLRYTPRFGCRA
ncbi:hypothetical protein K3495_g15295, partial [Podosphaera aphanis]